MILHKKGGTKLIVHVGSSRKRPFWLVPVLVLLVSAQAFAIDAADIPGRVVTIGNGESANSEVVEPETSLLFEGLDFRIHETERLKLAGRVWNMLLLSYNGSIAPQDPDAAVMTIQPFRADESTLDLETFATQRLMQIAAQQKFEIQDIAGEPIQVNGALGYEIIAASADPVSGIPVVLYQAILLREQAYYVVQGYVGAHQADVYVPEFKKITRSMVFLADVDASDAAQGG